MVGSSTARPRPSTAPTPTRRPLPVIDGGAEVADGLLRLAATAGRRDYGEAAAKALAAWSDDYRGYGAFAAGYALAVMRLTDHPTHVAVVGRRDDQRTSALRRAALALPLPQCTVASFDPGHDTEIVAREGYLDSDEPAAYVCAAGSCSAPVTDPAALALVAAAGSPPRQRLLLFRSSPVARPPPLPTRRRRSRCEVKRRC